MKERKKKVPSFSFEYFTYYAREDENSVAVIISSFHMVINLPFKDKNRSAHLPNKKNLYNDRSDK